MNKSSVVDFVLRTGPFMAGVAFGAFLLQVFGIKITLSIYALLIFIYFLRSRFKAKSERAWRKKVSVSFNKIMFSKTDGASTILVKKQGDQEMFLKVISQLANTRFALICLYFKDGNEEQILHSFVFDGIKEKQHNSILMDLYSSDEGSDILVTVNVREAYKQAMYLRS